jgi:hypothetical protein
LAPISSSLCTARFPYETDSSRGPPSAPSRGQRYGSAQPRPWRLSAFSLSLSWITEMAGRWGNALQPRLREGIYPLCGRVGRRGRRLHRRDPRAGCGSDARHARDSVEEGADKRTPRVSGNMRRWRPIERAREQRRTLTRATRPSAVVPSDNNISRAGCAASG